MYVDDTPTPEPGDVPPEQSDDPTDGRDGTGVRRDGVADGQDGDDPGPHDPLRFSQWMKRSATGAVLSGIAMGLQQALEPKRQLPAFVMEAPGEPEDPDAPITLHFDPDDPTKTVAVIRGAVKAPPPDDETPGAVDSNPEH